MKTVVYYGSTTGTTEEIARKIATKLNVSDDNVLEASSISAGCMADYDLLVLGSSTWGSGELQDDWYDALDILKEEDLSGKKVAIFGCGDASDYSDTFCDAIGIIYEDLKGTGCEFVGAFSTDGYTYDASTAEVDGQFVGLPIDEINESDKTDDRIDAWVATLA